MLREIFFLLTAGRLGDELPNGAIVFTKSREGTQDVRVLQRHRGAIDGFGLLRERRMRRGLFAVPRHFGMRSITVRLARRLSAAAQRVFFFELESLTRLPCPGAAFGVHSDGLDRERNRTGYEIGSVLENDDFGFVVISHATRVYGQRPASRKRRPPVSTNAT